MRHVGGRVPTVAPGGRRWRAPLWKPVRRRSLALGKLRDAERIERTRVDPHVRDRAVAEAEPPQFGTHIDGSTHGGPTRAIDEQGRAGRLAPRQGNVQFAIRRQRHTAGFAKQIAQVAVSHLKPQ